MPIETFRTMADRTPREEILFHDFTVDATEELMADESNWVPYVPNVHFFPLWFGTRSQPGWAHILRVQPGVTLSTHYHPTGVFGYTIAGTWHYLEHDWVANPGTFLWEPPGEEHTLAVPADSPEAMRTYFISLGGIIYVDSVESGRPVAYDDGFTLLELAEKHYREIGRDLCELYGMCR